VKLTISKVLEGTSISLKLAMEQDRYGRYLEEGCSEAALSKVESVDRKPKNRQHLALLENQTLGVLRLPQIERARLFLVESGPSVNVLPLILSLALVLRSKMVEKNHLTSVVESPLVLIDVGVYEKNKSCRWQK
jgi:hypothetical protein